MSVKQANTQQRVELIAWSGTVECLALRLGIPPAALVTALRRTQDMRRSPIKVQISVANSASLFAAARRSLTAAGATGEDRPGLGDHPLRVSLDA